MTVDALLVAAIICLSAFLFAEVSPLAIKAWRNRVRPGVQVCQQCVAKVGEGTDAMTTQIDYLLYLPKDGEKCENWPLVVFLHGAGERGHDLERVRRVGLPGMVERGKQFNFILVSPQCPANSQWMPEVVVQLAEHICSTFPVDRDRVYLTGYSMGGCGTWQTACQYPGRFAAIVPLCGGGDVNQAERLKDISIWAFHGAKDDVVLLDASEKMVDAVRECGGHVKFTVYTDQGHGIWGVTYQDPRLYDWLLAQRRPLKRIPVAAE